jgi:hypothetical protein
MDEQRDDQRGVSQSPTSTSASASSAPAGPAAPQLGLPKGGGAIRGLGESFSFNGPTGAGTFSVPIQTSAGRSGIEPRLALNYGSGQGNGPFGWGWSVSLPAITRKTSKGLPQYQDSASSDIFVLTGAEDLTPLLALSGGNWTQQTQVRTLYQRQTDVSDRLVQRSIRAKPDSTRGRY